MKGPKARLLGKGVRGLLDESSQTSRQLLVAGSAELFQEVFHEVGIGQFHEDFLVLFPHTVHVIGMALVKS